MRYLLFLLPALALAQEAPKAFEVVSIKPNAANDNRIMMRMAPGGRFTANGATLRMLMNQAYNVRDFQISGGPGWMGSDRFDVDAKGPEGMPDRVPPEMLRPMLKAMIEDKFQLKYHNETKEMPVYVLTQLKDGHKMKEVAPTDAPPPPPPGGGGPSPVAVGVGPGGVAQRLPPGARMVRMGRGQISANGAPMSLLIQQLSNQLGRPVIDKTGLKGLYDIELQWTPEPGHGGGGFPTGGPDAPVAGADNSGPSIFTALQEKLGLKLDSQKGPVEIMVIDSVSKPAEN
jgi:uncharacterized protein (TIGR03435 family)